MNPIPASAPLRAMLALLFVATSSLASRGAGDDADQTLLAALHYRCIGPYRGGRSAAVTGVPGKPMLFYFGSTGGGVWRSEDGGNSWQNISDGFFGGSIGAVAVAPSDPSIIYVGGGEKTVRGNVSHGSGMWKSIDGGKSWKPIGLEDSRHIARIRIHPANPDLVYVAAMGHLYGPNQQRGVFRSADGGKTWERILFASDEAGAVDLVLDPNNARVIYASTWKILRTPYSLESGGEGSALWKSSDGGDTWTDITGRDGLPQGLVGIIGVAVSPVDSNRVWAIIEAEEGGLFRSDNAGETWRRVNEDRNLRQRAWYYTRIYAGPQNIDEVYVLNVGFWRSRDGGENFSSIDTPHGDHHDLWIAPEDPKRMIIGDDGGAQVSFSAGENWSTYMNQPTAQFYRVTTDNHFPYRVYGAQQDNSTVRILSRSDSFGIRERDWEPSAGGESGHLAPDPNDLDVVYGGSYGGYLARINHRTGESRAVNIWPDNPMGHGAGDLKYRFQWNFPIFFSPNDPNTLYAAANVLFKTSDGGDSWQQISPDLTRNDASKLGPSGGPLTKDNTSVEYYCTIFAAAESTHQAGVIWAGSDDGLLHLTQDGGANWENVTPPQLPEWCQINSLEIHPFEPGGLYVAATRYKLDDFKPYLFKTTDYGKSWKTITSGIDRKHFTRVVRADPDRRGLLYAGTENGMYVSFDDGENWKSFQADLPIVPITDLAIKDGDLVVATQGRSFWILDDLTLVHQWNGEVANKGVHLFATRPSFRMRGGGGFFGGGLTVGENAPGGATVRFYLKEKPAGDATVSLDISDADGNLIQRYSTKPDRKKNENNLRADRGINKVAWNLQYPGAETFDGMVLWGGGTQGPRAVPATYTATLHVGEDSQSIQFEIKPDPRVSASPADFQAQFDFLIEVRDKLSDTHRAVKRIRDLRGQIDGLSQRLENNEQYQPLVDMAKSIALQLTEVEQQLYQTRMQSSQDPLNFPIRLNNRLSGLVSVVASGDNRPTQQSIQVKDELTALIDVQLQRLAEIHQQIADFNQAVRQAEVPAIFVQPEQSSDK